MNKIKSAFELLRLHHWIKNLLVFLPLITAHKYYDLNLIYIVSISFLSFSFCSSSIYIFNDIIDADIDKKHPYKKKRPIPSKDISKKFAIILGLLFLIIGLIIAINLNKLFLLLIISYILLNFLYSLYLKKIKYVDCFILVGFYILRIFSGAVVVNLQPSVWLIIFSFFIFLSLALAKRYIELNDYYKLIEVKIPGRAYSHDDSRNIFFLGNVSSYISVLTLMIYLSSDKVKVLYKTPWLIWISIPLLFIWVKLLWKKSKEKKIHHDPIVYLIKDKFSIVIVILFFLCFIMANNILL